MNGVKKRRGTKASYRGTMINPDRFHVSQLKFYAILAPVAVFMILPIIFILFNAFKPMDELFAYPPEFIVKHPTFMNFKKLTEISEAASIPAERYLFNSLIIALVVVVITLVLSVAAGYVLSKRKFRLRGVVFELNTLALMFVPIAVTVPRYLIMVNLGLINTFAANIVPLIVTPVGVFLIKQFVDQVPDSLIDAARIDGANDFTILWRIIVPLTKPALATVAILTFQTAWGDTEASKLFINSESLKNFAFYLETFVDNNNTIAGAGVSAAAALIMFLPNLIIFIFLQSKVMNTMAYSGLK
jgi:ABC-type glycerol-3-phosphate transport system permease component